MGTLADSKCKACGSSKFTYKMGEMVWSDHHFDTETGEYKYEEIEREMHDTGDWGGLYCANCDDRLREKDEVENDAYPDDEAVWYDWQEIDAISDAIFRAEADMRRDGS